MNQSIIKLLNLETMDGTPELVDTQVDLSRITPIEFFPTGEFKDGRPRYDDKAKLFGHKVVWNQTIIVRVKVKFQYLDSFLESLEDKKFISNVDVSTPQVPTANEIGWYWIDITLYQEFLEN